jgi:IS5 family transposase
MRRFAGIDLGQESAPDETTVCKFRHLLERNKLGKKLLSTVNEYLARNGIKISKGTIVDATIIGAPSSTKGKQWCFGMKAHVAVDSRHKLIHTVLASAANVADSLALPHLLRGEETCVRGDQAYQGHTATIRSVAPRARDCTNRRYRLGGRIDYARDAASATHQSVECNH